MHLYVKNKNQDRRKLAHCHYINQNNSNLNPIVTPVLKTLSFNISLLVVLLI